MFRFLSWLEQFRGPMSRGTRRRDGRRSLKLGIHELLLEDRLVPSTVTFHQKEVLPPEVAAAVSRATPTFVLNPIPGHDLKSVEHSRGPEWGEHAFTSGSTPTSGGSTPTSGGSTPTSGGSTPSGLSRPASSALTPAEIRGAYGVGLISFAGHVGVTADGSGQTIAIVDAYDDPNIAGDIQVFDQTFDLPAPPSFTKVNEFGDPKNLPTTDPTPKGDDWEIEESLDVEWAHAIAPGANIILVEATSQSTQDLGTADQTAENLPGVSVVSNSWGLPEFSNEMSDDMYATTPAARPGVTILFSSGDNGAAELEYPSVSPGGVAVGGTQLGVSGDSYVSETGWSGSGGGTSKIEKEPVFQEGVQTTGSRTSPDVSFDASPNSGVAVYDSYDFGTGFLGGGSWFPGAVGGTSLACPCWAGLMAIVDQGRALNGEGPLAGASQTLPGLYTLPETDYHDITTGNNSDDGHKGFSAGPGYDEVTGIGTPIANLLVPDLASMNFLPAAQAGRFYSATVTLSGTISSVALSNPGYKVTLASLGLAVSTSGDELTISGVPLKTGSLGLTVSVAGGVTQLESLTVNPDLTLSPGPLALPNAGLSTPYSQSIITASGGTGSVKVSDKVTASVSGLSVKVKGSTVVVSGTPKKTGSLTFQVTTSDKYGSVTEGYTVAVGPDVSLTALPAATIGTQYSQSISIAGGSGAVTTSTIVTSATLPVALGLSIAGTGSTVTVTGLPTTAGTISFSLVSIDAKLNTTVDYYTVSVAAAGPPTITQNPLSTGVNAKLNASFTAAAGGAGPITVQWQASTDGGPFTNLSPGGVYGNTVSSPTLVITKATSSLNGTQYRAMFTNASGSIQTTAATLTVESGVKIKGTKGGTDKNGATITPFSKVTVANSANPSELLTVAITLTNPALGSLSNLGDGNYDPSSGVYVLSGVTAAQAQAVLQALQFVGNPGAKTAKVTLDLTIANAAGASVSDSTTVSVEP